VPDLDVITVGGGLGGAALAATLARQGLRVLVLERERRFVDRVRGEVIMPWGVAEARALDLPLDAAGGHVLRWNDMHLCGARIAHRDLPATTAHGTPWVTFFHPTMQETLLAAARDAGAEIRRGVRVRSVESGARPTVTVDTDGRAERLAARLVVGADGRGSTMRRWGGFTSRHDPPRLLFAGLLVDGCAAPDDTGHVFFDPPRGRISLLFPQGNARVRAYVGYHREAGPPAAAERTVARFVDDSVSAGVPAAWYADARPAGPLAMFEGADSWVDHPYRNGIALIGDAAATSDPTWGQGMSLTLRDVHVLSDALTARTDQDAAGEAYAAAHDAYYRTIHRVDGWYADFFMEIGAAADARRAHALPYIAEDETRIPDAPFGGPQLPADDTVRRRFFAEDR
jgi:2-polyprenyl-6-methoxyphenol hydroxylase-like FAD-dependent oxidoreductase